jgi:uncharacterized protein
VTDSATTGSPSDPEHLHDPGQPPLVGAPPASLRLLPELVADSRFFWTAGRDEVLRILRCDGCSLYLHPPEPRCPRCGSNALSPAPVSGGGFVHSFTVNYQHWVPDAYPYVIAIVELDEQPGLRLTSNVVGHPLDDVHVGMRVEVTFEPVEDVWLPLFQAAR